MKGSGAAYGVRALSISRCLTPPTCAFEAHNARLWLNVYRPARGYDDAYGASYPPICRLNAFWNCRRRLNGRALHSSSRSHDDRGISSSDHSATTVPPPPGIEAIGIRERLRTWKPEEPSDEEAEVAHWERQQVLLGHAANDLMQTDLQVNEEDGFDEGTAEDIYTQQFDRMSNDFETSDPSTSLHSPGDILALPSGGRGRPLLAVFLKNTQEYSLLYNREGRLIASQYNHALFNCRNHFTEEELAPILAHVPSDPFTDVVTLITEHGQAVPRSAGVKVLQKLEEFSHAVDEAFRTHSEALKDVHSIVAHPTQTRLMMLTDVAAEVLGIPIADAVVLSEPALLAVSHSCVHEVFGFKVANRTYARSRSLLVESKYSAGVVERVTRWVRAYQEEASCKIRQLRISAQMRNEARSIHEFALKARKLVDASQQMRIYSPQGAVIGTKNKFLESPQRAKSMIQASFSNADRDIIHFLSLYAAGRAFFFHAHLVGMPAIIVRAVKGHEGFAESQTEVDIDAVHTLLVELGVMQPFANSEAIDRDLEVFDEDIYKDLDEQHLQLSAGVPVEKAAGLEDSMAHLRHDWNQLPIYCIDSASTTEVDDGISIENHPTEAEHVWVHVHVAHHSSHMSPDHPLWRLAENRHATHYLPEGKLPMMPSFMSNKFSVQAHAPVLTISMHLDGEARIVDYKIRPAIARNVQTVHSEQVDKFFGYELTNPMSPVMSTFAHPNSVIESRDMDGDTSTATHCISPDHHETLRKLLSISQKTSTRRPQNFQQSSGDRMDVSVKNLPRDPAVLAHRTQHAASVMHTVPSAPSYALNFPDISMAINSTYEKNLLRPSQDMSPANVLVSEMMVLANIVAGRYAAERDLPLVYYGTAPAAEGIQEQLPIMRRRLQRMASGKEPIERGFIRYMKLAFAVRRLSAKPIKHVNMDLEAYAKVTSPLRRYYDLVSLWQIDAAVRYETETRTSLKVRDVNPSWFMQKMERSSIGSGSAGVTSESAPSTDDQDKRVSKTKAFEPPYDYGALFHLLDRTLTHDLGQMRFLYSHQKHHIFQLFARNLYLNPQYIVPYYPEPASLSPDEIGKRPLRPGPDVLNPAEGKFAAVVGAKGSRRRSFILEGLEVVCDTEQGFGSEDGRIPEEGERWAVKVERVRLGMKRVVVNALRRLD